MALLLLLVVIFHGCFKYSRLWNTEEQRRCVEFPYIWRKFPVFAEIIGCIYVTLYLKTKLGMVGCMLLYITFGITMIYLIISLRDVIINQAITSLVDATFRVDRSSVCLWDYNPADLAPFPGIVPLPFASHNNYALMQYLFPILQFDSYAHYRKIKNPQNICPICLEIMEHSDDIDPTLLIPCGHLYHKLCLFQHWKFKNPQYNPARLVKCSLCRDEWNYYDYACFYDEEFLHENRFKMWLYSVSFWEIYDIIMDQIKTFCDKYVL